MSKNILFFVGIVSTLTLIFYSPVLNNILKKNIEPPLIICNQCKGTGEYPTDVNKLMMDASFALFVNKHLAVDKCDQCVKLKSGDGYEYCKVVNERYQILLKEYAVAGRKIALAACSECIGMGTFTCMKKDGIYMTQKEYDEKYNESLDEK